jgi:circadian clock protein KaiC
MVHCLPKVATGVRGFDELSHGGLPRNRISLLKGGAGSGKTVFALQALVHAARHREEPGIFVTFEEPSGQVISNTAGFDWGLAELDRRLAFIDARLSPDVVRSGEFDLSGLLAIISAKKEEIGARWIVFDGVDVLLTLLHDPIAEMQEVHRIRDWVATNDISAALTAKVDEGTTTAKYGFLQFMVDCVVHFERRLESGIPLHRVQITKYRGSNFTAGEYPVSIGPSGLQVDPPEPDVSCEGASTERISAGFRRLDEMLGGGLFRGSSTLVTGAPGTSKTTLAGKFAEAACQRGECTLFVGFDESADRIASNLTSVGIHFEPYLSSGLLRMYSGRSGSISAEDQLQKLKMLIQEQEPRCLVVDPLSAIATPGELCAARAVAHRLICLAKARGITVLVTAVNDSEHREGEGTSLQISMIADTWIRLSYAIHGGERHRELTIVKSRGTWHSNQTRELRLSPSGPTLADALLGSELLPHTLHRKREAKTYRPPPRNRNESLDAPE